MKRNEALYAKISAVLPEIAKRANLAEQDRVVPLENVATLKATGLHRVFQPKAYGGLEASMPEFTDCLIQVAGACASTAWAFGLMCTHNYMLAHFPKKLQDEVWADDRDATASSSIAPFGVIEEVDGGIILSGEFGWSSGCNHTEWAILGFHRLNAQGDKEHTFAIVPRNDYTIIDDWFATGARGTGSRTIAVKQAFVPEHRIQAVQAMLTEGASKGSHLYPDSKLFHAPYRPYFASVFAAIALGIAERALAVFKEQSQKRTRAYTGASVGSTAPILMRLGESTHQIAAARALMELTWEDHRIHAEARKFPSQKTAVQWRTNQAYAIKMCTEAVDRLFSAAGGSAWRENNEMQRLFRDVHIAASHAYTDYDLCSQAMGREQMGMAPDPAIAPAP